MRETPTSEAPPYIAGATSQKWCGHMRSASLVTAAAAAKALIDWLGSPEAQKLAAEKAYRLPARTDLPPEQMPEWARDVSTKLVAAKLDWDRIGREGPAWMSRWDREVRGKGK